MCWGEGLSGLSAGDTEGDHPVPALGWRQIDPELGGSMLGQKDIQGTQEAEEGPLTLGTCTEGWFFPPSGSRKASKNLCGPCW